MNVNYVYMNLDICNHKYDYSQDREYSNRNENKLM